MSFYDACAAAILPLENLTLSQWAETHAYLSAESSAQAGKWHAYPYQVGLMDAITDPANEYVTFMKSARVGYTKIINHTIGYHIHQDPCPLLVVQATIEDAEGYSKEEVAPMLRDTQVLKGLVADPRARFSDNTIKKKLFPGGSLTLVGANSARGFRRLTVRKVIFDEVDAYPATAGLEGDQIKLGVRRTETYWNRQIIIGGTPTIKNFSRAELYFNQSDQRYYYVPCPHCGTMQRLRFKRLKWPPHDPARAYFQCKQCNKAIGPHHQRAMVRAGKWIASKSFDGHAGFHIWAAYSFNPHMTWPAIATEFMRVKNNPDQLRTFINTVLGECWEEKGEGIAPEIIATRKETYEAVLSNQVYVITAGVDVQLDRLEVEIVAWGAGLESWSLDYIRIPGDPHLSQTWQGLDNVLARRWKRDDGIELKIKSMFIDSGYATTDVYRYCYSRQPLGVHPTKGQAKVGTQIASLSKKKYRRGLRLINIATITAKDKLFAMLETEKPGPGFCHFPDHYDDEYFDMLTAEQVFTRFTQGVATRYYRKIRNRNEALDCRVLALAALEYLEPNWNKLKSRFAKAIQKQKADNGQDETQKPTRKRKPARRQSGFVHGWKG
jgi:phage terminase large subunit GpA-like protein